MNIGIGELLIMLITFGVPILLIVGAVMMFRRLSHLNKAAGGGQTSLQINEATNSALLTVGKSLSNTTEVIDVPDNPKIAGRVKLHVDAHGHVNAVELRSARTILPESVWNESGA